MTAVYFWSGIYTIEGYSPVALKPYKGPCNQMSRRILYFHVYGFRYFIAATRIIFTSCSQISSGRGCVITQSRELSKAVTMNLSHITNSDHARRGSLGKISDQHAEKMGLLSIPEP
jgi:hypothetical protein